MKKRVLDIRTTPFKASRAAWLMSASIVLAAIAALALLLLPPASGTTKSAKNGTDILATAPAPDHPRPLNADGAPRSD
jgi:hypothetical protein